MVRIPTHGPPTHPGRMLLEEFLTPLGMSQKALADRIGVSFPRVNELVHGKRGPFDHGVTDLFRQGAEGFDALRQGRNMRFKAFAFVVVKGELEVVVDSRVVQFRQVLMLSFNSS